MKASSQNSKTLMKGYVNSVTSELVLLLDAACSRSLRPNRDEALAELGRSGLLFLATLQALTTADTEMSIRLLKEVERLCLFPKVTLYMGGKLKAEFDIPTSVLEDALCFGERLISTGLVSVPEPLLVFLQSLVKENFDGGTTGEEVSTREGSTRSNQQIDRMETIVRNIEDLPNFDKISAPQIITTQQEFKCGTLGQENSKIQEQKENNRNTRKLSQMEKDVPVLEDLSQSNNEYTPGTSSSQQVKEETMSLEEANLELFRAIEFNDIKAFKKAIKNGAEMNETNAGGCTPLHIACLAGNKIMQDFLIARGADVNRIGPYGLRPLHCAALKGDEFVTNRLLLAGAHVDSLTLSGWTALHCAAVRGKVNITKILVRYGANFNCKTKDGVTALTLARRHYSVAEFLRSIGGIE